MTISIFDKKITVETGLTYDDLLLLPNYTDFKREEVDLSVKLHPKLILKLPVISSPMDTVTEEKMAEAMAQNGGLGIIHRNLKIEKQKAMVAAVKKKKVGNSQKAALDEKGRLLVGAAVGVGSDFEERVKKLNEAEVDLIVIDSAHGHSKFVIEGVRFVKNQYPHLPVMAGNIATSDGAKALADVKTDILRVGMGPGAICTTRVVTGMGVPQVTALINVLKVAYEKKIPVIADGGITQIGDIAKALALGATAVMLGSLLARFDESPGKLVIFKGKKYKQYRGMGSIGAMKKGSSERYGQSGKKKKREMIAEGVEGLVPYQGKVFHYLYQIEGSLRASFYYLGARNLDELFKKARFIKITQSSLRENHPHSIIVTNPGKNYEF